MIDQWNVLERHVKQYDQRFTSDGRQPRDKDWRPVRFAVRDVILGHVVARLQEKDNVIEVDVFMTYDPAAIPGRSGTKFASIYTLSQAYKTGSTMGIRFTRNVNGGPVPDILDRMAMEYGVFLNAEHIQKGILTPKEARHLYLALTEFSDKAEQRIMELSVADKVSPERICYMVHHATFTKEEMESLLLGTEYPENILLGKVSPQEYLLYQDAVLRARDVVLGGMLDRTLRLKEIVGENGKAIDLEGNDRYLSIEFDPSFFAKVYETEEDTPIPWTGNSDWLVPAGERMVVMVRARDWADFQYYFSLDLESLESMKKAYSDKPSYFFLLVPRNVAELEESELEVYRAQLSAIGITLMVCPESVALLDQEVMRRLRECETMRHDVGDGEERATVAAFENEFDFNTTEMQLVAVPSDLVIGRLSLEQLTEQAIYDEDELFRGVNKHNVRGRYHLVCDRLQFLAHQALAQGTYQSLSVNQAFFPILESLWNDIPGKVRNMRLLPTFWVKEQMKAYADNLKLLSDSTELSQFRPIIEFLAAAYRSNQVVIAVQNKHSSQKISQSVVQISAQQLTRAFVGQFVPDWVNDYGDLPFEEVVMKHIWRAVQSARRGQANGVNFSEVPHKFVTQTLHSMVYESPKKVDNQDVSINIVYTDGSQARPFPLFCLKWRDDNNMRALRQLKPLRVGMISHRHPDEMDAMIHQYWFRNIEVSQSGMTSAEVDELSYQLTLNKLGEIYRLNQPMRLAFYQTGFQAPLVGFWRAVVEFLKQRQGNPPMLEITPFFYTKRPKANEQYEKGDYWN